MTSKICFVAPAHSIHTQRWVQAFDARDGYDVTLVSPYGPPSVDAELGRSRVIWYRPPARSEPAIARAVKVLVNFTRARGLISKGQFDLVHIHQLPPPRTVPFFAGIPRLVVSTWGADVVNPERRAQDRLWRLSRRFILRQAKVVTATSRYLAEITESFMPSGEEASVVPFGIEVDDFICSEDEHHSPEGPSTRLVVTKHLRPKYGIDHLLKALRIVVNESRGVELVIAGEGEQRNELEFLVQRLNLQENVRFLGWVPHCEIANLLCGAQMYVMPSVSNSESFGVAAIEAQAARLPVVAASVGGVPEVVLDGKTGLLVPPGDVEALAKAILRLIDDRDLGARMGQAGRKFVREHYSWSVCVEKMHQVYEGVLGR